MTTTITPSPTVTAIDYADPDVSTDVCHLVTLSDGRTLHLWSGQAAYGHYDRIIDAVIQRVNDVQRGVVGVEI